MPFARRKGSKNDCQNNAMQHNNQGRKPLQIAHKQYKWTLSPAFKKAIKTFGRIVNGTAYYIGKFQQA